MGNGSYRFQLGLFECTSLSDGSLDYPLQSFFANVPTEQIEEALRQVNLPTDYITTPYTYLLVNTGAHRVLVDMGAGHLGPRTGKLIHSMRGAGIDPAEVDTVVITHAHPDHIGGTLDDEGQPIYENAQYYIAKEEWDFWFSESAAERTPDSFVAIARDNLAPIRDHVHLVEGETVIVPGVRVVPAPGHTPGHSVVQVVSLDQRLYYIADTVLYPLHLEHPDWIPVYDILPETAAASKRTIFDLVAKERAWVVGQHFPPFPSLGHVIKSEDGWKWQPIRVNG